jgi:ribosomal protein S18 acetylase RimI-like enzyme
MPKPIHVRDLRAEDLSAIVTIEDLTTGVARRDYWKKRMEISEAIRPHWTSLVAEMDNRVVGFIFGRAGELEFGLAGSVAWIEIIGVHPAYRRKGVAAQLMDHFISSARDHGIRTFSTLVRDGNDEMEDFFTKLGFVQGKMLHFQKE